MGDFQQNTITNRQAVLDYIDANSGGGTTPNLAQVLTQGQYTDANPILSNDTIGNLYSELLLRSDYTTLTYFDNDTSIISQLSLEPAQCILVYDDLVTNGVSATFLASQNAITSTFYNVTTDVQTGLNADTSSTQIYYIENATPIENIIKVDVDGYYLKDVPAHDDNAAAIIAGLTAGYIFKTTGSGAINTSGVLCIVE